MARLKALEVINSSDRNSSVDVFRGLAILSVVLFHFNHQFAYGFLGVDLFFVVSGLLVGGLLTKEFEKGEKINFLKFFLQRGFKIWPSYYTFILSGSLVAFYFYYSSNPDQVIPLWDLKRYLLFYQNYTGSPRHWSFDHVWSLCVEEHFYILLPVMFLVIQVFFKEQPRKALFVFVGLTIVAGIVFKHLSFFFTNGKDTYSATHNRIDALAWGVLLNLLITYKGEALKTARIALPAFVSGLLIFVSAVYYSANYDDLLFDKLYFHSIIPFSFFLVLLGAYYFDLSRLKPLRFIAYYSYNWYLWHPIFVIFITKHLGNTIAGLLTYLVVTFTIAVITTVLIEETFLKKRKAVLDVLFRYNIKEQISRVFR